MATGIHLPYAPSKSEGLTQSPCSSQSLASSSKGHDDQVRDAAVADIDKAIEVLGRGFTKNFKSSVKLPLTWVLLAATGLIVGISSWQLTKREYHKQAQHRQDISYIAKQKAEVIETQFIRSVSATFALGSFIRADAKNVTRDGFEEIAATLIDTYGGITNLQFQPFGVLTQIYPLSGSEGAIGHALFVDPKRVESATATASSGKLTFMGPIKLIQGGVGVIARYPIYTEYSPKFIPKVGSWWPDWRHNCCEDMEMPEGVSFTGPDVGDNKTRYFWGFAGMLTLVEKLVEGLHLEDLEGKLEYQLSDLNPASSMHPSGVFIHSRNSPPGVQLEDPVVARVEYSEAGVQWEFRMTPVGGWPAVSVDFTIQLSLLLTGALFSAVSRMMNMAIKYAQELAKEQLVNIRETLATGSRVPSKGDSVDV